MRCKSSAISITLALKTESGQREGLVPLALLSLHGKVHWYCPRVLWNPDLGTLCVYSVP